MNGHVVLNHIDHLSTRVLDEYSEQLGDGVNSCLVFPIEFRELQSHYPIFFRKNNETGQFYPAALLGFATDENLFLKDAKWDSRYIPLMMRKQPFFIGFKDDENAVDGKAMMMTLDPESPKVSDENGESLFNPDGSPTAFLQDKMDVLERVHQGYEHSEKFVEALAEHDLLEPFTMEITLQDGSTNQLLGFYTLNEEKVQSLSGAVMEELASQGFLFSIFMVLASHSMVAELVDRKNIKNNAELAQA